MNFTYRSRPKRPACHARALYKWYTFYRTIVVVTWWRTKYPPQHPTRVGTYDAFSRVGLWRSNKIDLSKVLIYLAMINRSRKEWEDRTKTKAIDRGLCTQYWVPTPPAFNMRRLMLNVSENHLWWWFPEEGLLTIIPRVMSKIQIMIVLWIRRRVETLTNNVGDLTKKVWVIDRFGVTISQHEGCFSMGHFDVIMKIMFM